MVTALVGAAGEVRCLMFFPRAAVALQRVMTDPRRMTVSLRRAVFMRYGSLLCPTFRILPSELASCDWWRGLRGCCDSLTITAISIGWTGWTDFGKMDQSEELLCTQNFFVLDALITSYSSHYLTKQSAFCSKMWLACSWISTCHSRRTDS